MVRRLEGLFSTPLCSWDFLHAWPGFPDRLRLRAHAPLDTGAPAGASPERTKSSPRRCLWRLPFGCEAAKALITRKDRILDTASTSASQPEGKVGLTQGPPLTS